AGTDGADRDRIAPHRLAADRKAALAPRCHGNVACADVHRITRTAIGACHGNRTALGLDRDGRVAGGTDAHARATAAGLAFDGDIARRAANRMVAGLHDDARTLVIGSALAGAPYGDVARSRFDEVG